MKEEEKRRREDGGRKGGKRREKRRREEEEERRKEAAAVLLGKVCAPGRNAANRQGCSLRKATKCKEGDKEEATDFAHIMHFTYSMFEPDAAAALLGAARHCVVMRGMEAWGINRLR